MLQEMLDVLAIICIENDMLDEIDLNTIIDDFVSKNVRSFFNQQIFYIYIVKPMKNIVMILYCIVIDDYFKIFSV